jgi:hypothetical protein
MNSAYLFLLPIDADITLFSYDLEADSRIVLLRIVTTCHTPTRALLGAVVDRRRSIVLRRTTSSSCIIDIDN